MPGMWPCVLITRRSQVQILPPLPTSSQVRGPFPLGEGLLHVWPVTRSVTRTVTRDVSAVALRLILGRNATGRDIRDAIAGSRPRRSHNFVEAGLHSPPADAGWWKRPHLCLTPRRIAGTLSP
jgi:hypothetical protein